MAPEFGRSGFRMFALHGLDGAACTLSQTEKTWTGPMGPRNLTGDKCEGPIAAVIPFELVRVNPRTLCCCHSVACTISSMLAPSGRLRRFSMRSCLVMRSTVDSSALTGVLAVAACSDFETTDRGDFLPGTVAGVTLRRLGQRIWHSPFWGRALGSGASRWKGSAWSGLPLVRGAEIGGRTTQSPAHRGASPQRAGGWPSPPADAHSNACFAGEVQSNSDGAARLRRLS